MDGGSDDNTIRRVPSFSCYLQNPSHKISAQHTTLANLRLDFTMKLHDNKTGPTTRPSRAPTTRHKKGSRKRKFFSGFGCKGPCFCTKDVLVHSHTNKETPSYCGSKAPKPTNSDPQKFEDTEESRKSIEVFGSGTSGLGGGEIAKNLERKLSMLTWDAIPKAKNLPTSTVGSFCDDMASEASSDLFEIENISGSVNPVDVSMSPTSSYYAPSEASIEWSVVTADYYPPNSDYNEEGVDLVVAEQKGGIFGCKAVDVAETRVSRKEFSFSLPNSQATHKT